MTDVGSRTGVWHINDIVRGEACGVGEAGFVRGLCISGEDVYEA